MESTKSSCKSYSKTQNIHRLSVSLLNARGISRLLNNDIKLLEDWILGKGMNSLHMCLTGLYAASNVYENGIAPQTIPMIECVVVVLKLQLYVRMDWCILQQHMSNRFTRATLKQHNGQLTTTRDQLVWRRLIANNIRCRHLTRGSMLTVQTSKIVNVTSKLKSSAVGEYLHRWQCVNIAFTTQMAEQ
jgi:hypothetical protein